MLTKIVSKKVDLPVIFLVENEEDFKQLPRGIPYVCGQQAELPFIRTFLEFQVLFKSCIKTGIAVKWLDCLKRIGYNVDRINTYTLQSGGVYGDNKGDNYSITIDNFIEDQYLVNFDKLSELKVLPVWLDDLKTSIETNIINEVTFDPTAFNKQMGMNTGYSAIKTNKKNLLILDISSSMPKGVVITITNLAKLMSKKFYADVILTGKESYLIDYEDVPNYDIVGSIRKFGGGNEGTMYTQIMKVPRDYGTVISFGDNDSPYTDKKDCKITVETLYTLHTEKTSNNITGYAKCFTPKTTNLVKDWIQTIEK